MKPKGDGSNATRKARLARDQIGLADALDVSTKAVQKWKRRDDWPFGSRGPYDVDEVQQWRLKHLLKGPVHDNPNVDGVDHSEDGSGESRKQQLDNLLKQERAAKLRLEREILANKYLKRENHVRAVSALIASVRDKIETFVESMPTAVEHAPASTIRTVMRDWYDRFCEEMQGEKEIALIGEPPADDGKDKTKQRAAHAKHNRRRARSEASMG